MNKGELRESFSMAISAIIAHKLRSCLTLLGVLVGVFSIVVVMTAMRVLQQNIESELAEMGSYTFAVAKTPAVYFGGPEGYQKFWRRKNITYAQAQRLTERATLATSVGVHADFYPMEVISRWGRTPPNVDLIGASPGSFPARNWTVAEGRGIGESDLGNSSDVCVLGSDLAKVIFPFGNALGERIKLQGINYKVIGVLEKRGATLGANAEMFAIIPLTTGLARYGRSWQSVNVLIQAANQELLEDTMEQVRGVMRVIRKVPPGKEDDFEIFSNDSMISQFQGFTRSVRVGIGVVSSIALIAAGIGIMNIMLVSVTERTKEIGIRRAIGAKKRNIMSQFIMEAVILCQIGGILGVLLGILGGNAAAVFLELPPTIPFDWAALGLIICSIVGIVFGVYPAFKAANLDPIESLRYE